MTLLGAHLGLVSSLRAAGVPVSLAEGLDAVDALGRLPWDDRETVRTAYAATLLKRTAHRPTFDTLFDVWFPALVGGGVDAPEADAPDSADALADLRERLATALTADDQPALRRLAAEAVGRFGAMQGRGPGLSSWSAYTALRRVAPQELVDRIANALMADLSLSRVEEEARRTAERRVGALTGLVEADARRRVAEEKGADHVASTAVGPSLDRLDFALARQADLAAMRREIYPLARRLATRMARQRHAHRRGPLDVRRTVRASVSTGGVPITTHHRPRRPHRTELVVLCDVSGSVASFAQFTLMLVYALSEQFGAVRAFTFVDQVHEVTDVFRPGADLGDVLADLAARSGHAARWGRTNYGRAFTSFVREHPDAVGPRTALLVLGDARSNYSDLGLPALRDLAGRARHSWWLNPEHPRHWDTGDSAARSYAALVPMVECRNLAQLADFVRGLA